MSRVTEINSLAQLESYRLLWNALLPLTRGATFFHSLDWLRAYWRHFGEGQKLRVLIVEGEHGPIGILPLVVATEKRSVGSLRVLTYPLADWGAFYGPIGPNPTATLLAGLRHVAATPRDWDLIDLRWINMNGADHGRTRNTLRQAGLRATDSPWKQTAQVDTRGNWDDYWTSRKSHFRTNVRRSEKKLAEMGDVKYIRYRPLGAAYGDDDPRWDLYEVCEKLSAASWQNGSETGTTMSHEAVRDFLHDAHLSAVRGGALDLNLLYVGDVPVAFAYNYHYLGYVFGLRMGYDAGGRWDGAGTVLQLHALRDSFQRGDQTYDLGPGYLECKRHWWTSLEPVHRATHFPATNLRVQALRAAQQVKGWLKSA